MGESTIWDAIRERIAHWAWRVFLWAGPLTEKQFREEIYLDVLNERFEASGLSAVCRDAKTGMVR